MDNKIKEKIKQELYWKDNRHLDKKMQATADNYLKYIGQESLAKQHNKGIDEAISKIATFFDKKLDQKEKDFDEKIKAIFDELEENGNIINEHKGIELESISIPVFKYIKIKKKWVEPSYNFLGKKLGKEEKMEKRADELEKKADKVIANNKRLIEEIEGKE